MATTEAVQTTRLKFLNPAKETPVSIVKENIGVINARNLPLWQLGKKRPKDAVSFV